MKEKLLRQKWKDYRYVEIKARRRSDNIRFLSEGAIRFLNYH